MKGITGIMANDLSKTANDILYTVNQFTTPQDNGIFYDLRSLNQLQHFAHFEDYQKYTDLNASMTILVGKLSLLHVNTFFINEVDYPLIGSITTDDIKSLRMDRNFGHMTPSEAASGVVQWFRSEPPEIMQKRMPEQYYYYCKKSVYDPAQDRILGTLFIGIPESYFSQLFKNTTNGKFSLYSEENLLIAGMDGSAPHLPTAADKGWMLEQTEVPGTPWRLTFEVDKKEVTGEITQRFSFLLMGILIVLFIFLFISFVIARGLNRPIGKLMRVVKQYGEGNTSIRYSVKGQDEIAQLGGAVNHMLNNIHSLMRKIEEEQEEKRTIELYALFSQIQPHFLLNTLNSIKCNLALEGDFSNSENIDSLMILLRAHLRVNEPLFLYEECDLLTEYMSIMRLRNRINIKLDIVLPDLYRQLIVPRLLLQPLVENCIIHGIKRDLADPCIRVIVQAVNQEIEIRVEDNGGGISEAELQELNEKLHAGVQPTDEKGVGLHNVKRRLSLSYGEGTSFAVMSNYPNGFVCIMRIPGMNSWKGNITWPK
ncbi:histidine kinase [Paenibacillus sp. MMS20-IR301]|uniref:sensor histidine kinase n=1 Tax=Paenibacillus sp. MMS20-IR301 TaxID=2895946 RepID=UPI0028EDC215|nr:histidine kinase [Paenibacillus sp. MMS20-IR301]WNS43099.1 histidine kinase [Paenibacillus sp. MMS20-IR301]